MNNLMFIISDVLFILLYVSVHRLSVIVQKRTANAAHPLLQSECGICKRIPSVFAKATPRHVLFPFSKREHKKLYGVVRTSKKSCLSERLSQRHSTKSLIFYRCHRKNSLTRLNHTSVVRHPLPNGEGISCRVDTNPPSCCSFDPTNSFVGFRT